VPVRVERRERIERLSSVKARGERGVHSEPLPLGGRPRLGRQLGGLARAHLRAEQHRLEASPEPGERNPRRTRLAFAPLGQAALRVLACAVGLGLRVPK
jgi:hypothetical protein